MICKMINKDVEKVLQIWLDASQKAHDFISFAYWESKLDDMKDIYLLSAENYVFLMKIFS